MSNTITIARPYAKAIFEHALVTKKLSQWSEILQRLAVAALDEQAKHFITNPTATVEQQVDLLMTLFAGDGSEEISSVKNLIVLLAQNKRIMLLPDIKAIFEVLRAEQEKTLKVDVISFSELSSAQQERLISALSNRLQRQVTLNLTLDKSLLGGAVIHAGDLVIDGSVRGRLNKLSSDLAA
ncbi:MULTISPECIES: F0F1 ATP synthase subunit delta [Legionella]|uniref:ATP synthase subunit delta n=1 Tax=Legionella maceachernii TaxID=466 RepID=A0A0W0VVV7_9GAMM|nr:F0F1 ATP synthase subunit delta [Legionella maceachernii]KTD24097.1 ATP synthase F1 subunit delta [Legionella maceachernii]SJZ86098.1 F-type H+-transporting ATPase subunit delta [Legionella maceachernii]SUO99066.1 F-type ATPase subunit delta [Legionella maceachernii]